MKKKLRLSRPAWVGVFVAVAAIIVVLGVAVASLFADGGEDDGGDKTAAVSENETSVSADDMVVKELTPEPDPAVAENGDTVSDDEAEAVSDNAVSENEAVSENAVSENEAVSENAVSDNETTVLASVPPAPPVAASNSSCKLIDASRVHLTANFASVPASDDGKLHIYQMAPYQYSLDGAQEVGSIETTAAADAEVAMGNMAVPGLYCKYVFAAIQGGAPAMQGEPQYITNPEILATNTRARVGYPKKGLTDYFYNWNLDTNNGIPAYIMQINNYGNSGVLRHPMANQADSHMVDEGPLQYMFNAANADGVNALANAMKGVANMAGTQDYIIGNEVNVRKWCYIAYTDWDNYVREYMQGFRVAYNAIKSTNANARVFICLDQNWDRNMTNVEAFWFMDGKDFIDKFNAKICAGGNIDWGLAFHPHPVPLTYAKIWDMGAIDPIYARMVNSNSMISFQNMSVITNYMTSASLRSPSGAVRAMMASETGISANQGADVQAAAVYASYQACVRNPYVDIMIYSFDDSTGARFTEKAWEIYNNMGGPNDAEYDAWAKSVIGISDWGQLIR